jgi:predicted phosphodiesterase
MQRVLITDTHFGIKQNSIGWLESQMEFLDKQVIPYLKSQKGPVRFIHMGDVFDSRSSISPLIAKRVRDKFLEIRSLVEEFIIVAGNHDFYSPNSDDIDSLSLIFKDCDIRLVIKEYYHDNDDLFIPWYQYKDTQLVESLIKQYNPKNLYTHADIFGEDYKRLNVRVFSGHIHIPFINKDEKLYNIGSCYSINFADANSKRGFYVLENDEVNMIANDVSISFHKLYNEDIFDIKGRKSDYYEFYIDQNNLQKTRYTERISDLVKTYKNAWVIPIIQNSTSSDVELTTYDILSVCREMVPEHLKDKLKIIEERVKTT